MFGNWKAYIINMAMPYEKGKVESGSFCLQWTCIIFNVNIQVWPLVTRIIAYFYSTQYNSNQIYNIISFETITIHIHYEPLIMQKNDHIQNVNCALYKNVGAAKQKKHINCHKPKEKNLPYKVSIRTTHLILSFFANKNAITIPTLMIS